MEKVRGIGGVFLRAKGDRQALLNWYRDRLGIDITEWGGFVFDAPTEGGTTWSIFAADTGYFGDPANRCMINYKVDDLDAMLAQLRKAGVDVADEIEDSDYGKFGWCTDPEGNRVELWQPPEEPPGS